MRAHRLMDICSLCNYRLSRIYDAMMPINQNTLWTPHCMKVRDLAKMNGDSPRLFNEANAELNSLKMSDWWLQPSEKNMKVSWDDYYKYLSKLKVYDS